MKRKWPASLEGSLTLTHPAVPPQSVACRTATLVAAECVDTAEGAEQGVLAALIDICTGNVGAVSRTQFSPELSILTHLRHM